MPIYDYECTNCGLAEERIVSPSEKDAQTCVDCDEPMRRTEIGVTVMRPQGGYQVKAIMGDGSRPTGSFGAPKIRGTGGHT